jgi:putative ABC transport system ATP-binding protein
MAETVASLRDIRIARGGNVLLDGVSLEVTKGETVLITGPSGSGKSTILRTVAGIDRPDSGEVAVFGQPLPEKEKKLAKFKAGRVGVGFQSPRVDGGLSVRDNLFTLAEMVARPEVDIVERVGRFATMFGIAQHLDRQAGSLSGGEKQRLAMAQTLVACPEVLLLDEPTSMIDPTGKAEFVADLRSAVARDEDTTVIMVTHDQGVGDFPHREVVVNSGRVVSDQQILAIT